MTKDQAKQMIKQVLDSLKLTKQEHIALEQAFQILCAEPSVATPEALPASER